MQMKRTSALSRIRQRWLKRIRSVRKPDKIGRACKGIYLSLLFSALSAEVPKRKIDHQCSWPVSCRTSSERVRNPLMKTDRVESHASSIVKKRVDQRNTSGENLDLFSPNVTIGAMGDHYLIRIMTYKKYTPLSKYLSTFEVESMDVINVTIFTSGNKVFYAITIQAAVKSQWEIDVLHDELCGLASTRWEQDQKM